MGLRRIARFGSLLVLLFAVVAAAAFYAVPGLRWRAGVIALKGSGELPGVGWFELIEMLDPRSPHHLAGLLETRNPFASIVNPFSSEADREAGEGIFQSQCALCHGTDGKGGTGPSLAQAKLRHGDADWALYKNITQGIPGTAMQGLPLESREAWQLVTHLRSLSAAATLTSPAEAEGASESERESPRLFRPVEPGDLLRARAGDPEWLTYSGDYTGRRYSALAQLNRLNVSGLSLVWMHQLPTIERVVETSPLVTSGVMFISEPPSNAVALDVATGRQLWAYRRAVPDKLSVCCGRVNRGLAVLNDTVYLGTLDAHLIALDAETGAVRWDVEVADAAQGYTITAAPLAIQDKVVMGISGAEFGIRGFLDAYDAETGERLWRFWTVPEPGAPGNESWAGDSWEHGGGSTWVTGSYDPELDLLYWGVGNPSPDFNGDVREGDNLYTDSVIALRPETGELVWHYQFTPHDEHDWAANQVPVLVDRKYQGIARKLMLWGNRNAFYYVLDRETGEFLHGRAFVHQNWSDGFDSDGRPQTRPDSAPRAQGTLTYPGAGGATNWWSPSYSPRADLFYLPTLEQGKIFFKGGDLTYRPGRLYLGGSSQFIPGEGYWTGLRALDPESGELRWEFAGPKREHWGRVGGALSTAGNLVFWGDDTAFFALDSDTGEKLWSAETGGRILAAPVTYRHKGRQYVTIAAGRSILTFGLGK